MLDIRFIRENPKLVEQKAKQKGYEVDIDELLRLDEKYRELLQQKEDLSRQRNSLAGQINGPPALEQVERGRELREKEKILIDEFEKIEKPRLELWKAIPNIPTEDVPIGASEDENIAGELKGEKPHFDFEPKTHWEITEKRNLIDKERAAKTSGSRFAYIKGDLVKLQFAIIQFTIDTLTNDEVISKIVDTAKLNVSARAFIPVLPPLMIRTEVYDAMDRLEPRDDRYKVGEDSDKLWLQGSAEHTLGPMYANEILLEDELPIRYLGYATSFRREAGTYGKDTEGILRMHQFDKLEMESFTKPEDGLSEHLFMIAVQEYLMQQLRLPYQVIQKCTADIGKPNARGIDINVWLPGAGEHKETHTADYMTDYQSRRLNTRYKKVEGMGVDFVHTNDATAFALGRTLVAIIENYQNDDGTIRIPDVLQPYMSGISVI